MALAWLKKKTGVIDVSVRSSLQQIYILWSTIDAHISETEVYTGMILMSDPSATLLAT